MSVWRRAAERGRAVGRRASRPTARRLLALALEAGPVRGGLTMLVLICCVLVTLALGVPRDLPGVALESEVVFVLERSTLLFLAAVGAGWTAREALVLWLA